MPISIEFRAFLESSQRLSFRHFLKEIKNPAFPIVLRPTNVEGQIEMSVARITFASEEIMTTLNANPSIAITKTTEQDLMKLGQAFLGNIDDVSPDKASDDYLVAVILGWHMRNLALKKSRADQYVFTEFALRRGIASGGEYTDEHSDVRALTRGQESKSGNFLTIDGVSSQTIADIERRMAALIRNYEELFELADTEKTAADHDKTWRLVASLTDEEIIDIGTWSLLHTCSESWGKSQPFPKGFEVELLTRGG